MMQGDSYGIRVEILKSDGSVITSSDVSDVEISIGSLRKTHKSGKLSFADGNWVFPITQKETLSLPSTYVSAQVRVAFPNGDVEGVSLGEIRVQESTSKAVL